MLRCQPLDLQLQYTKGQDVTKASFDGVNEDCAVTLDVCEIETGSRAGCSENMGPIDWTQWTGISILQCLA